MDYNKHVLYNNTEDIDIPLNFIQVVHDLDIKGKLGLSLSMDIESGLPKLFFTLINEPSTYKLHILLDERPMYLNPISIDGSVTFSNQISIDFDSISQTFTIVIDKFPPYIICSSNYPELQLFLHHT